MKKYIFLDIDGVLNSRDTMLVSTKGIIGIDSYKVLLVDRIVQATGAQIVLSSSWRHSKEEELERLRTVLHFIDITPSCCAGIRGVEIYEWIAKHVPWEDREALKYAILDDDSDMLLWQKDHFFKTKNTEGLTEEIAQRVIEHLA